MSPPETPDALDAAEILYDRFVALRLEGETESAASYLRRHGVDDGDLLERLEALDALASTHRDHAPTTARPGLPYERLGPYRLLDWESEGGMGTVFLAEHETLGSRVALKLIRVELASSPTAAR